MEDQCPKNSIYFIKPNKTRFQILYTSRSPQRFRIQRIRHQEILIAEDEQMIKHLSVKL